MRFIVFVLSVLSVNFVYAGTISCQIKNQMEMIHFVKKHDLDPSGSLYILELHTLGEPFAHTATEGLGQIKAGKELAFKSYDFDLSAVLLLEKGIGSFTFEGKFFEFTDCFYQP